MQNLFIVGFYLLVLSCLFIFRDKVVVPVAKNLAKSVFVALALIGLGFLCGKAYFIFKAGLDIPSELIAPSYLNAEAEDLKGKIAKNAAESKTEYFSALSPSLAIPGNFVAANSSVGGDKNINARTKMAWVLENDFTVSRETAYRGRFIHHYSTILFPYRQIAVQRKYALFASPQYGFISILPLFFFHNTDFVLYVLCSLPLLIISLGIVWYVLRSLGSKIVFPVCAVLLLLVSLDSSQGALLISPGFAFYRYFPAFLILSILIINQKKQNFTLYTVMLAVSALCNSFQFNLLLLIITFAFIILRLLKGEKLLKYESLLLLPLLGVLCYQGAAYAMDTNLLKVVAFGSVGEGMTSLRQAVLIFLLPLAAIAVKYYRSKRIELSSAELLSYLAYGFLCIYSLSFAGSPQHYVGFLLCALTPISVIISGAVFDDSQTQHLDRERYGVCAALLMAFLFLPSVLKHFVTLPAKMPVQRDIYTYKPFGSVLRFGISNRLDVLSKEFDLVLQKHGLTPRDVYLFSKDKIYIELFKNANYLPENYDSFLNLPKDPVAVVLPQAKKDGVNFIVLDSPRQLEMASTYLNFALNASLCDPVEVAFHQALLKRERDLESSERLAKVECNSRWCLYKIKS